MTDVHLAKWYIAMNKVVNEPPSNNRPDQLRFVEVLAAVVSALAAVVAVLAALFG